MSESQARIGESPPRPRRRAWPWIAGGVGVLVVAVAIAIPVSVHAAQQAAADEAARIAAEQEAAEAARLDTFRDRLTKCGVTFSSTVQILDSGEAVQLNRVTKYDGPTYSQMTCVLNSLDAPAAIEAEISQTRALDGRQTDEWDGYSISWSYHPHNGASILIEHAD
ncbi:hypothetical protein [Microbacterium sp. Kw_RZR3]|uniref:hypothetical protein n=1 Tax=unclassified Microbacterium TaxID=2609290 RepID=UPI0023DA7D9C|nr:hypothetical protein [Microbacterium sp. Kw_RZR3]MDF2045174.1 hypothetical protein [Microbacterium sp. Kw_RZR3]